MPGCNCFIDCDICAKYSTNSLKEYVNVVILWVMDYIVVMGIIFKQATIRRVWNNKASAVYRRQVEKFMRLLYLNIWSRKLFARIIP